MHRTRVQIALPEDFGITVLARASVAVIREIARSDMPPRAGSFPGRSIRQKELESPRGDLVATSATARHGGCLLSRVSITRFPSVLMRSAFMGVIRPPVTASSNSSASFQFMPKSSQSLCQAAGRGSRSLLNSSERFSRLTYHLRNSLNPEVHRSRML